MSRSQAVALIAVLLVSASLTPAPAFAGGRAHLPTSDQDVPLPSPRPDTAEPKSAAPETTVPAPQPKPDLGPAEGEKAPKENMTPPQDKATSPEPQAKPPAEKPDGGGKTENGETPQEDKSDEAKNPPIENEDEKDYAACLADLRTAGAGVSELPRIDDGNGCGIDKPLQVREILPGIQLKPEATMRCKTALQLNRWIKGTVLPSAELAFGADKKIKAVDQATSYACRNRNSASAGKLSEHARGNAIDIAGFTFADGSHFEIAPRERDSTLAGAFERAIMATACLYFTTVLGPGSDAAHETHLHLDVIERKAGYRYCW